MLYFIGNLQGDQASLPLSLILYGINYKQEPIFRTNGSDFYQWFYCSKGIGAVTIGNGSFTLHEGELLYIPAFYVHSYRGLTDNWTLDSIGIGGACARELLDSFYHFAPGIYKTDDPVLFKKYLKKIHQVFRSNTQQKNVQYASLAYDFLLDLTKHVTLIDSGTAKLQNDHLQNIVAYMDAHFRETFTLQDLSDAVGLSREYICKLFKKHMNQTVFQYLNGMRVAYARIYLDDYPEKKIQDIAHMCGFESASYFCSVFSREVHMTPKQFRNHSQEIFI